MSLKRRISLYVMRVMKYRCFHHKSFAVFEDLHSENTVENDLMIWWTVFHNMVFWCALSQNSDRAHYPRYSTIRGNFQIVAIYKDFKEISSDNVTTILESPATDSPFSVLQNFPFAGRTISRSNPGYACSQSPVKAQRTVRS